MTRLIDVCVPNARDHGRDGVPARVEDWNRCDMATEMACRCGFPHAMQNTIAASWPSRNAIETEEFLDSPAWEWQHEDLLLPRIAPDLPAHAAKIKKTTLIDCPWCASMGALAKNIRKQFPNCLQHVLKNGNSCHHNWQCSTHGDPPCAAQCGSCVSIRCGRATSIAVIPVFF